MEIQLLPQNSPMIKTEVVRRDGNGFFERFVMFLFQKEECCSDSCVGCRTCLEPGHSPISGCARCSPTIHTVKSNISYQCKRPLG